MVMNPLFFLPLLLPQEPVEGTPPQQTGQDPAQPRAEETVVTATGFEQDPLFLPYSIDTIELDWLRTRRRTFPEILQGRPSVMVQKTAPGQTSPFLRGLTGYHTQLLVDGIPLNHAGMRSGPNQYWSTVDHLTVEQVELVRGPSSVMYGSDAVGGTVNAITRRAAVGGEGTQFHQGSFTRFASAEGSWTQRLEASANGGSDWGVLGGITFANFGNLQAGSGELPNTAYRQTAADLRFDRYLGNDVEWTVAAQTMRQLDVPRTHKTIYAVPFAGSSVGKEWDRDQDQTRDLYYTRARWSGHKGWMDEGEITLSVHRHAEDRDRLRSGDRRDLQGFDLFDYGLTARFRSEQGSSGQWSWGMEIHRQKADTFRHNFVSGAWTSSGIQGAFGDDSTYDSAALYMQDEIEVRPGFSLIPGVRASYFSLESNRVDNPDSGPAVISVDDSWTALTGGIRAVWDLNEVSTVYTGLSQGFRAPSLSDVTALDATSAVETPSTDLGPEHYLQWEIGTKGEGRSWSWQTAAYQTWINDMIVQSPTGTLIDSVPEVQKSNDGDGWIRGVEVDLAYAFNRSWNWFGSGSWMRGEVDQVIIPSYTVSREPASRMAPTQFTTGLRWTRDDRRLWGEAWAWVVDNQDLLALRDATDTSRIPPGGTPGYAIFGLTGGYQVSDHATWTLSLDNLGDKDYRVHGSGLNGPGFNVVLTLDLNR